MEKMGQYCKAYPIEKFRQFSGWIENSQNLRKEKNQIEGKEEETQRELTGHDFLYLQDNFTVTDGIFVNQDVIFDQVTPEWIDYCKNVLQFEIPEYQRDRSNGDATEKPAD
jgi:hypothetical protein